MLDKLNNAIMDFIFYRVLRLDDAEFQKKVDDYNQMIISKIKTHWLLLLTIVLVPVTFANFYMFNVNISPSLPQTLFLTHKGDVSIVKNQYVHFKWHGGATYDEGVSFVKIVKGVPGDIVTMDAKRNFFINGEYVGTAKAKSRKGEALAPGFTGKIPPHYFYAFAPHKDSLDSRYAVTGLISERDVVGRAYPLF